MKKILILEDNQPILAHIAAIVQEIDSRVKVYPFDNVKDAYQCANEKVIDLFIIDIILENKPGDSSGLRFVENIRKINHYGFVPIIFVTSLEDAKLYTYEKLHCYRFIEKPFDDEDLKQMVEQCLHFSESQNVAKTLYFRKDGIILAVEREDIVYAESVRHIMHIHTRQEDTLCVPYITLKKLMEDIDSSDFIQCSRRSVVNKKFVKNIDITNRIIQLKNTYGCVEIGISFKNTFREI
ncbi:response regulator transcription factor [Lachnospiraceae bacterium MD335]|nr:response regulator transcription factor [Lachnospiraceae bacterium MD335]